MSTGQARRNYRQYFPDPTHESKFASTDPELVELFENFAFGEVLEHGTLDARRRLMAVLAALVAQQGLTVYRLMLEAALNVGVTPVEVKEILYQSMAYVGVGKLFDFLTVTNEVLTGRGVALPLPGQSTTTAQNRFEKGFALEKATFGQIVDDLYTRTTADQMHIQRWVSAACYGDLYCRSGLDMADRELVTFAFLLAMGDCWPELKAHIAGNLQVGNGRQRLIEVATQLVPFVGYPRVLNALACINEAAPEARTLG